MEESKMIDKLLKKAEVIHDQDITDFESTNFLDMPFEDFIAVTGELYFHEEQDAFYKRKGDIWYRYKHRKEAPQETGGLQDNALEQRVAYLENWGNNMAKNINLQVARLNAEIEDLKKSQAEEIKYLINYTDLKLNEHKIKEHKVKSEKSSTKPKKESKQ